MKITQTKPNTPDDTDPEFVTDEAIERAIYAAHRAASLCHGGYNPAGLPMATLRALRSGTGRLTRPQLAACVAHIPALRDKVGWLLEVDIPEALLGGGDVTYLELPNPARGGF